MAVEQKITTSYNVQIWCGLKEGYDGIVHTIDEVNSVCQKYVDAKKECVTVSPTSFIYTDGNEPGVVVGFISYPRFPKGDWEILSRAKELAEILMKEFNQNRVTITTPEVSIMLENEKH